MSTIPAVMDYQTGSRLTGTASAELIEESRTAGDTGAVSAYRGEDGMWQYVADGDESLYRDHCGVDVITVYVED